MHNIGKSVVQASQVIYLHMDLTLMKLAIAFWTFDDMCWSKDSVLSRRVPRYFTLLLSLMRSGPAWRGSRFILVSCWCDPNMIYFVFFWVQFEAHTVHPLFDVTESEFHSVLCLLFPCPVASWKAFPEWMVIGKSVECYIFWYNLVY